MTKKEQALELAKAAAQYLYDQDQDFVVGGCSDVSEVIEKLLHRRGYAARRVYGAAKKGKEELFLHAWLMVEGQRFDPVLWVQLGNTSKYQYFEDERAEGALKCPGDPDELKVYVDEVDQAL